MTAEKSEFVILKLRSGDEIVAKRNGSKKGSLPLSRPLQLQRSTLLDPLTGQVRKTICVFRDWLEFTTQIECEIPNDYIVMEATPSPDLIAKYEQELKIMDTPKPQLAKGKKAAEKKAADTTMNDMIQDLIQKSGDTGKSNPNLDDMLAKMLGSGGMSPMVTASFSMPPDVFLNIILNMPMFDGWGQEMPDDEDFGDDDEEGEPPSKPNPPEGKSPKKPKKDDDHPPGWNGRFGFPK
jgi:hypothetical protein